MHPSHSSDSSEPPPWGRPQFLAQLAITCLGIYLCYRIALPFLTAATWAVALAVVGLPLHRRLARGLGNRNWAAGLSTTAVVLAIGVPVFLVVLQLGSETIRITEKVEEQAADGQWKTQLTRVPYFGERLARLDLDSLEAEAREGIRQLGTRSVGMIGGAVEGLLQALVAVFILFFCFRDRHHLLAAVQRLLPLPAGVSDKIFDRACDAVYATVYGTLLTAAIQGTSGGLLFLWLGLPLPLLWGVVMFVLGVLPFVGAFLVWVPAAIYLAMQDRWGGVAALAAWGLFMAGPMCNYVYACAAGDRMKLHPVPALLAFIGGLAVFGVSGMVLGPCILAATVALLDAWRHRSPTTGAIASANGDGVLAARTEHPVRES